jgi:hypothetical protein
VSELPPWDHRGVKRLQRAMIRWVKNELNKQFEQRVAEWEKKAHSPENLKGLEDWFNTFAPQIEEAKRGKIEPLRRAVAEKHPELLPFIHLPKQPGPGKKFLKLKEGTTDSWALDAAVEDVRRIRELWQKIYRKKNRSRNDPVTAEAIAAELWEVDVEDVCRRMKKISAK